MSHHVNTIGARLGDLLADAERHRQRGAITEHEEWQIRAAVADANAAVGRAKWAEQDAQAQDDEVDKQLFNLAYEAVDRLQQVIDTAAKTP